LWSLTSYMRALGREELPSGRTGRRAQVLLIAMGVVVSVMMIVMGVIREHSRQPYLISGEMTINNQQITNDQPSAAGGSTSSSPNAVPP
jgi:cytochrome bd-type quinol oxidase subunit 1